MSHEIVLGWQGFGEAERKIRRRFQQKYKQSWHALADTVLANGSLAHPREHTKAVAQRHAQNSRDSRTIAQQKQRGAEQATVSVDSLYSVCKHDRATNRNLHSAIAGLFVQVQNPSPLRLQPS